MIAKDEEGELFQTLRSTLNLTLGSRDYEAMYSIQYLLLAVLLVLSGCQDQGDGMEIGASYSGYQLRVVVTGSERKGAVTIVHGRLSMRDLGAVNSFDISGIRLATKIKNSKAIYIDSIAHQLTDRVPVNNGSLDINVYWVFDGELEVDDKAGLKLATQ